MYKDFIFWATEYLNYFSLIFWGIKLFLKIYDAKTKRKEWVENVIIIVVSVPIVVFCVFNYQIVSYSNAITYLLISYFFIYFRLRTKESNEKIITLSAIYIQCMRLLDLLIVTVTLEINRVSRYVCWNLENMGFDRSIYMCLLAFSYYVVYYMLSSDSILFNLSENVICRLFMCIYTMLGIFCFCRVYQFEYMEQLIHYWTFYLVCLFIFCGTFLYYFFRIKEDEKNRLLNLRNDLLETNYQTLHKAYDENRMMYHDFRNHMLVLNQLIKEEKNQEALGYISTYIQRSLNINRRVASGCEIIDIIVNCKIAEANEKHINFLYEIDYIGKICIEDIDLCALLANLLDNAIEASEKIEKEKRSVYLKIKIRNHMLFIWEENSMQGVYREKNKFFQTDKKNRKLHGLGMKSIDNVVQKYDGHKEYNIQKNKFQIYISLPID